MSTKDNDIHDWFTGPVPDDWEPPTTHTEPEIIEVTDVEISQEIVKRVSLSNAQVRLAIEEYCCVHDVIPNGWVIRSITPKVDGDYISALNVTFGVNEDTVPDDHEHITVTNNPKPLCNTCNGHGVIYVPDEWDLQMHGQPCPTCSTIFDMI